MSSSSSFHHSMFHPSQFDDFATVKVRSGPIAVQPPTAPATIGSSNVGTVVSADAKFAIPSCDTKSFAASTTITSASASTTTSKDDANSKEGPTPRFQGYKTFSFVADAQDK